jgi:hypothetical protein
MAAIHGRVPFLRADRPPAPDIAAPTTLVRTGWFRRFLDFAVATSDP